MRIVLFINVPVSGALIIYLHRFAINLMWSRKNVQLSRLSWAIIKGRWLKPLVHLHRKGVNCMLWMAVSRFISRESINWHIIRIRSTLNAQRVQWFFQLYVWLCACSRSFLIFSNHHPFSRWECSEIYILESGFTIFGLFFFCSTVTVAGWCYCVYAFFHEFRIK